MYECHDASAPARGADALGYSDAAIDAGVAGLSKGVVGILERGVGTKTTHEHSTAAMVRGGWRRQF